ncbi:MULTISPECIES: Hsp70 family protein [unclassified Polaromonas]|uniref:Hsp70 family protein n=1 Tax=unclassified Polaromonas TaxID=2638319 RepID=UPI0018C9FC30|nr:MULTISPECIES: Hsp70 family protein [unclassified Polaromonas]MBG6073206.1 molecular chaperone DnaK (HSP70) [Polaromonas sp. CG_9.7]MBG6115284.1 molecular chaperone DnaK (HSP70) [Polaromonas sp. CG_9.2]MDH6183510.1 molecular chaperone DnaK (HSP70) [Polaromonas sp. CG_23.6]
MSRYIVGIDLGTTHTVVAYAPLAVEQADIRVFDIDQLVAPGEVTALPLLPSVRFHPADGEMAASALQLPWPADSGNAGQPPAVIGQWARRLGAQVPGRLVASAKSWLSHAAVDRLAPILPWGAPDGVPKISPVEASASYLRHVRAAWNARFPDSPLERQELRLTVPASFDEGARALTLDAARQAGLPTVRLLEEPQAAFHDWLLRHQGRLDQELAQTRRVLVCDVGGGTTDLSLIDVDMPEDGGPPRLTRVGVGNHLMLGGDNMDLALAHAVEARMGGTPGAPLSAPRLAQLMDRCRAAKEVLLAHNAPEQTPVTLLGGGARLVGGSRTVMLQREEVERLIVDGFFPQVGLDAQPVQARGGIVAFGLPYARDATITRHIAAFLRQHGPDLPDALLLNGGVFRAGALAQRLAETLGAWRGAPLRLLHNDNPDVAVARGAVAHGLAQRGLAPRIGGGSARSYFLRLDEAKTPGKQADAGQARGICILPRGSEPGHEALLSGRSFALRVGQPVRFQLFSAVADGAGQAPPQAGELVTLDDDALVRLPPLVMVLAADPADPGASNGPLARQDIAVQLAASLTDVGTLELHCVALSGARQRWLLAFDLRQPQAQAGGPEAPDPRLAARMAEAIARIDRIFGTNKQPVSPKEVTQLRAQLERLLGDRAQWTTPVLRQLFDALWQRERGRRRSAAHERVWLNLAGYGLRPGFGDALDAWRVQQLWTLLPLGVQHPGDRQVGAEWWTLWRRVAGGLDATQQLRLLDDFAFNLQISEEGADGLEGARPVSGSAGDMLRLGASLERIPPAYKSEIGEWLLGRMNQSGVAPPARQRAGHDSSADDSLLLWALGRIGTRAPFHGSPHDVVPPGTASAWTERLLALDWKRLEAAAFAAVNLARVTDDRARDLPPALREQVLGRLRAIHAPVPWLAMVAEKVELDEATERRMLGESLPPGLRLMG